jgi:hypothetical protein
MFGFATKFDPSILGNKIVESVNDKGTMTDAQKIAIKGLDQQSKNDLSEYVGKQLTETESVGNYRYTIPGEIRNMPKSGGRKSRRAKSRRAKSRRRR